MGHFLSKICSYMESNFTTTKCKKSLRDSNFAFFPNDNF
jgi:hypothetical protein